MHPDPYASQDADQRHHKSGTALVAVRRALDAATDPAAAEFRTGYDWLRSRPAERFARIWRDPTAYLWARVAYELLATARGTMPPTPFLDGYRSALDVQGFDETLALHLHQFKRFLLSAAFPGGEPLRFDTPLVLPLPAALPELEFSITGAGPLVVTGLGQGVLTLSDGARLALDDGAQTGPWRVQRDPVITRQGFEIRLQPALFHWPGLTDPGGLRDLEPEYQHRHAPLVESALACIERYLPWMWETLRRELRVMALKPFGAGGYGNVTHSDLPGACVMSVVEHPLKMADSLIHEFHHHRLFVLEESGRFFDEMRQDPHGDCRYYSPWRGDPRPLHGILHALYVFLPVREYWQAAERDTRLDDRTRAWARSQWVLQDGQLRSAAATLRKHGIWSEHGAALMAALEQRLGPASATPTEVPVWYCDEDGRLEPLTHPSSGEPLSAALQLELHASHCAAQYPELVA